MVPLDVEVGNPTAIIDDTVEAHIGNPVVIAIGLGAIALVVARIAVARVVDLVAILVGIVRPRIEQAGHSEAGGLALDPGNASNAGIGHGAIVVAAIAITSVVGIVAVRAVG